MYMPLCCVCLYVGCVCVVVSVCVCVCWGGGRCGSLRWCSHLTLVIMDTSAELKGSVGANRNQFGWRKHRNSNAPGTGLDLCQGSADTQ